MKITTSKIKKRNFSPRLRTWKLRDPDIINKFTPIFNTKLEATQIDPSPDIEEIWSKLKTTLLESRSVVCGSSSKHQWRPETWWWDDRVEDAINEKRRRYRTYKKLRKQGHTPETIAAKEAYNLAKRVSKHVVWIAKSEAEKEAFAHISPNGNEICHIAKQMDKTNQDVVGEKCVNDAGELSLSDDQKMKSWVEYYSRLLNVEFEWPSDTLDNIAPTSGPPPPVTTALINEAIKKMKFCKATGPSGIVAEMLASSGEKGVDLLTRLTECVFSNGVIPTDWQDSFILNLYKGKGDALERGNYRGLKLTDQVMKLVEHVLEIQIR